MADFLIASLRGGQNDNTPTSIGDDQCTSARNVEFWRSTLGERRPGATAIDLAGSPLEGCVRVTWMHRHLPTADPADAQFWAFGVLPDNTPVLCYKDTTWHAVAMPDAPDIDQRQSEWQGQTLHGKLFIAYSSGVDRLHVYTPGATALRRTGLAQPTQPINVVNSGSGSFSGTRYYRVRFTEQSSGVTLRRSEPSDIITGFPSGSGDSLTVTCSLPVDEGETHWELEASLDNVNFYVLATTPIATTTVNDSTDETSGYAVLYDLSEDIGDYENIPSVRFLTAEQDRLIGAGNWVDEDLASRVLWTPVHKDPGVGNDERIPLDTDNYLDLDGFEGGRLTGLSASVNGYVFATKWSQIYQIVRTGVRAQAYEAISLTKQRGALPGSVVEALDATGNPTPFFLDPDIGPCRIGPRGVEPCGADLRVTWESVNLDASIIARACYFNEKKQIHWWIATGTSMDAGPSLRLVLHTQEMRETADGVHRGWAVWDGGSARALSVCLFADNIDAGIERSNVLKPLIGLEGNGLIWQTDTGSTDNGTAYAASITTKPFIHGSLLHQFEVKSAALLAQAADGGLLDVTLTGNFGETTKVVSGIALTPDAGETRVIRPLDDLGLAELTALQVTFADPETPGTALWALEQFAMREVQGSGA